MVTRITSVAGRKTNFIADKIVTKSARQKGHYRLPLQQLVILR